MSGYLYLLLSGMQSNDGLLAKTFKTFPKSPLRPVLTFDKDKICTATCRVFVRTELRFSIIKNLLCLLLFLIYLMVLSNLLSLLMCDL